MSKIKGDNAMKLEKNTRAYRAYENGKKAYNAGKPINDSQYITGKVIALNSWFIKGWLEASHIGFK